MRDFRPDDPRIHRYAVLRKSPCGRLFPYEKHLQILSSRRLYRLSFAGRITALVSFLGRRTEAPPSQYRFHADDLILYPLWPGASGLPSERPCCLDESHRAEPDFPQHPIWCRYPEYRIEQSSAWHEGPEVAENHTSRPGDPAVCDLYGPGHIPASHHVTDDDHVCADVLLPAPLEDR